MSKQPNKQTAKGQRSGKVQEQRPDYFKRGDLTDPETLRQVLNTDLSKVSYPPTPPLEVLEFEAAPDEDGA